ncbi:MAG TPA: PxKF domain-containing protein, partial [Candidatus Limnocylindrales bacterium]|nr:PxKF domain-containing protein [Candidatus Limnocylindrales bacterium]
QPINIDGTSVSKQGSTVPAKFRVCDAFGQSIGTPGVVTNFVLYQKIGATNETVNEVVDSTTPDTAFRWSATDQQWIFNINTKPLQKNYKYFYRVDLNDGSSIYFAFSLK